RAVIAVQAGDTWQKIGQRYGLTLGQLERINRRSRREALKPGETIVVYVPADTKVAETKPEQGPSAIPPVAAVAQVEPSPEAVAVEVVPPTTEAPEPEANEKVEGTDVEGTETDDPTLAANPNEEVEL